MKEAAARIKINNCSNLPVGVFFCRRKNAREHLARPASRSDIEYLDGQVYVTSPEFKKLQGKYARYAQPSSPASVPHW